MEVGDIMDIASIVVALISSVALIFVAAMQLRAERHRKRTEKELIAAEHEREEREQDDMRLSLARSALNVAIGELSHVTAKKVTGQLCNGDVKEAMEEYRKASDNLRMIELEMTRKYLKSN